MLLRDAGVVTIATVRGRGRSVSSPWTPVAPVAGARSAAATVATVAARGAKLRIVVLDRVGIEATRLRARATRIRVRVGVTGLPVPLVVLGLIEIVVVEHLILMPIQVIVYRRRGQMRLVGADESSLVRAVVVG